MPTMRIHELAKELGVKSKEIIFVLRKYGVNVESHMTILSDKTVEFIKKFYALQRQKAEEAGAGAAKEAEAVPARYSAGMAAGGKALKASLRLFDLPACISVRRQEQPHIFTPSRLYLLVR